MLLTRVFSKPCFILLMIKTLLQHLEQKLSYLEVKRVEKFTGSKERHQMLQLLRPACTNLSYGVHTVHTGSAKCTLQCRV